MAKVSIARNCHDGLADANPALFRVLPVLGSKRSQLPGACVSCYLN